MNTTTYPITYNITWTPQAVTWWRLHTSTMDPEQADAVLQAAKANAARDDRAVVSANDLAVALAKVVG